MRCLRLVFFFLVTPIEYEPELHDEESAEFVIELEAEGNLTQANKFDTGGKICNMKSLADAEVLLRNVEMVVKKKNKWVDAMFCVPGNCGVIVETRRVVFPINTFRMQVEWIVSLIPNLFFLVRYQVIVRQPLSTGKRMSPGPHDCELSDK